jgi:ubiquinol-cytochrome c reductase cytochrome c1 subunit
MNLITKTLTGLAVVAGLAATPALAAEEVLPAKDISYSFEGPFGVFDRAQLQRGYLVYKEVCATCHSMRFMKFRNLGDPGGPEFSAAEVKAIAASFEVTDGPNSEGEMFQRPGLPSDAFVSPYPNEEAARAAFDGALPPDLSLITKSRSGWEGKLATLYTTKMFFGSGGPQYVYSVLTGYQDPPADAHGPEGKQYNPYFAAGPWIAMPPPLSEDAVTYGDGTKASVDQMARDVSAFLAWTAEPKMEARKRLGFEVLIYMAVLTILLYLTKKAIWARIEH